MRRVRSSDDALLAALDVGSDGGFNLVAPAVRCSMFSNKIPSTSPSSATRSDSTKVSAWYSSMYRCCDSSTELSPDTVETSAGAPVTLAADDPLTVKDIAARLRLLT